MGMEQGFLPLVARGDYVLQRRGAFREIIQKKSSENYKGLPYITTLLSTSLWTFYGVLDPDDGILIVTVNGVGVASQIIYLIIYLFYASKERKVKYAGLIVLDILFLGTTMAITLAVFEGDSRRTFVGVLCATFTIAMYAAPLSVVVPNTVGIVLGSLQLLVYFMYRKISSSSMAGDTKEGTEMHDLEQPTKLKLNNESGSVNVAHHT
ncbi:Bidirectional sugar transporter SWEET1 [Forsythia ovata]|uniref:Bidirectional sugar transporter SWEET1 n=1 Tax=Forsythia ovata TaxID=205694 RepID=A0ABD1TQ69_9LAMI